MKKLLSLICMVTCLTYLNAQPPVYDDLLILYADANYPKLIKECLKYSEKDETKNDAIVFLYLSKAYYKISFIADRDEEFKNAYKDCFGAIGKCLKKDKEGKLFEKEADFFNEVKKTLVEVITNELEAKDYRKTASWASKAYKITPVDIGAKYLEGACKYRSADKGGANALWKEADKLLGTVTSTEKMTKNDMDLLKMGIFETAQCYIDMRQPDKAKALVGKVAQWFENDETFKAKYDEIVN